MWLLVSTAHICSKAWPPVPSVDKIVVLVSLYGEQMISSFQVSLAVFGCFPVRYVLCIQIFGFRKNSGDFFITPDTPKGNILYYFLYKPNRKCSAFLNVLIAAVATFITRLINRCVWIWFTAIRFLAKGGIRVDTCFSYTENFSFCFQFSACFCFGVLCHCSVWEHF